MPVEISIIVPVYNLKPFLTSCVESILAQSFTNFELILVNDGSTDGSAELCDSYAAKDERIRVIHQENKGVAAARNSGLDKARGRFIGFVDNDDLIHPDMFLTLYETIKQYDSNLVICDFKKVTPDFQHDKDNVITYFDIKHFDNRGALHQLYTQNDYTFVVPWNKLYKRELFTNVRYKTGFTNDDETVIHELLYQCRKVTYIRTELYYYVQRKESLTGTFQLKRLDFIYALQLREQFFREKGESELHSKALKHFFERFFWYYFFTKTNVSGAEKQLTKLKKTYDATFPHLFHHKQLSKKEKLMCLVFRIHPSLYEVMRDVIEKRKSVYSNE